MEKLITETRERLFFLDYAPVLIASALTGENVEQLFRLIADIRKAARLRIGTGVLNRLLRAAFEENPPPTLGTRRLKLFYAAQARGGEERTCHYRCRPFGLYDKETRTCPAAYAPG